MRICILTYSLNVCPGILIPLSFDENDDDDDKEEDDEDRNHNQAYTDKARIQTYLLRE